MASQHELPILEMLTTAFGTGGVMKFLEWWSQRGKSKAYTMGAVDHAVQTAMQVVTDRLKIVEAQHAKCEVELREVNRRLDASERERAERAAEVERLMRQATPGYAVLDLKRPPTV